MAQWIDITGRWHTARLERSEITFGPPRRFCALCGALRVCFCASERDDTPRCAECSKQLGLPTHRNAFKLRERQSLTPLTPAYL